MEQVKIYDYYSFGYNYRMLINERDTDTNEKCYEELTTYMNFIKNLDLRVSLSSVILTRLKDDYEKLEKFAKAPETQIYKLINHFGKNL